MVFVEEPIVVDVVLLLGRDVNGWVLIVELLLHLLFVKDGQGGWLSVTLLILILGALLLAVVLLFQTLLLILPLAERLDILLVRLVELGLLVK